MTKAVRARRKRSRSETPRGFPVRGWIGEPDQGVFTVTGTSASPFQRDGAARPGHDGAENAGGIPVIVKRFSVRTPRAAVNGNWRHCLPAVVLSGVRKHFDPERDL